MPGLPSLPGGPSFPRTSGPMGGTFPWGANASLGQAVAQAPPNPSTQVTPATGQLATAEGIQQAAQKQAKVEKAAGGLFGGANKAASVREAYTNRLLAGTGAERFGLSVTKKGFETPIITTLSPQEVVATVSKLAKATTIRPEPQLKAAQTSPRPPGAQMQPMDPVKPAGDVVDQLLRGLPRKKGKKRKRRLKRQSHEDLKFNLASKSGQDIGRDPYAKAPEEIPKIPEIPKVPAAGGGNVAKKNPYTPTHGAAPPDPRIMVYGDPTSVGPHADAAATAFGKLSPQVRRQSPWLQGLWGRRGLESAHRPTVYRDKGAAIQARRLMALRMSQGKDMPHHELRQYYAKAYVDDAAEERAKALIAQGQPVPETKEYYRMSRYQDPKTGLVSMQPTRLGGFDWETGKQIGMDYGFLGQLQAAGGYSASKTDAEGNTLPRSQWSGWDVHGPGSTRFNNGRIASGRFKGQRVQTPEESARQMALIAQRDLARERGSEGFERSPLISHLDTFPNSPHALRALIANTGGKPGLMTGEVIIDPATGEPIIDPDTGQPLRRVNADIARQQGGIIDKNVNPHHPANMGYHPVNTGSLINSGAVSPGGGKLDLLDEGWKYQLGRAGAKWGWNKAAPKIVPKLTSPVAQTVARTLPKVLSRLLPQLGSRALSAGAFMLPEALGWAGLRPKWMGDSRGVDKYWGGDADSMGVIPENEYLHDMNPNTRVPDIDPRTGRQLVGNDGQPQFKPLGYQGAFMNALGTDPLRGMWQILKHTGQTYFTGNNPLLQKQREGAIGEQRKDWDAAHPHLTNRHAQRADQFSMPARSSGEPTGKFHLPYRAHREKYETPNALRQRGAGASKIEQGEVISKTDPRYYSGEFTPEVEKELEQYEAKYQANLANRNVWLGNRQQQSAQHQEAWDKLSPEQQANLLTQQQLRLGLKQPAGPTQHRLTAFQQPSRGQQNLSMFTNQQSQKSQPDPNQFSVNLPTIGAFPTRKNLRQDSSGRVTGDSIFGTQVTPQLLREYNRGKGRLTIKGRGQSRFESRESDPDFTARRGEITDLIQLLNDQRR